MTQTAVAVVQSQPPRVKILDSYLETLFGPGCLTRFPRGKEEEYQALVDELWKTLLDQSEAAPESPTVRVVMSPRASPYFMEITGFPTIIYDANLEVIFQVSTALQLIGAGPDLIDGMFTRLMAERLFVAGDIEASSLLIADGIISVDAASDKLSALTEETLFETERLVNAQVVFTMAHELCHVLLLDPVGGPQLREQYKTIVGAAPPVRQPIGYDPDQMARAYVTDALRTLAQVTSLPLGNATPEDIFSPEELSELSQMISESSDMAEEHALRPEVVDESICDLMGAVSAAKVLRQQGYDRQEAMGLGVLALEHLAMLQYLDVRISSPSPVDAEASIWQAIVRVKQLVRGLSSFLVYSCPPIGTMSWLVLSNMLDRFDAEYMKVESRFATVVRNRLQFSTNFQLRLEGLRADPQVVGLSSRLSQLDRIDLLATLGFPLEPDDLTRPFWRVKRRGTEAWDEL